MVHSNASSRTLHTILVASPDFLLRRSVFACLEPRKIAMQEACDFQSCLTSLIFGGPFSAVIIDTEVSRFGNQLIARLTTGASMTLPCIIVSNSEPPEWARSYPFLGKPLSEPDFASVLNSLLDNPRVAQLSQSKAMA